MSITFFNLLYLFYFTFALPSKAPKTDINPYIKGYFNFPINPGVTTSLSGSFGDIRINHFHAGLDIRTGGREGKSVYAAAEGYVSRIMVTKGGYGNALYITHPNGLTTLYGHLKEYSAKVKKHLLNEQYSQQAWEVDLYLGPDQIPVRKGEMVALSGNTGGSGGPHLHFEIRDENENTLDPSLFGFKEIKDNVAPVIEFISIRCLSPDARINGKFGDFDFKVTKTSTGQYILNQNISVWGDIGFELYAYDKAQTTPFKLGIKSIKVEKDNVQTYKYKLNKLAFYNKLDMNLHTNYERMVNQNKKLHKCYYEAGNSLGFYEYMPNNGILDFRDSLKHQISISLTDAYNNSRNLSFALQSKPNANLIKAGNILKDSELQKVDLFGSLVRITRKKTSGDMLLLDGNRTVAMTPKYTNGLEETFVFDLEDDFFSKYMNGSVIGILPVNTTVSPIFNTVHEADFEINFKNTLYHSVYLNLKSNAKKLFLDKDIQPLSGHFEVKWQTQKANINIEKDKVYLVDGRRPKFQGGTWINNQVTFEPKELGTFEVLKDITPPAVEAKSLTSNRLLFKISDKLSGINSFECYVNNEWLLMEYEYKNGLLWSERLNNEPLKGEIELRVVDHCNNETVFKKVI